MNGSLTSGYHELRHQLLLGLEPVDVMRGGRLSHGVDISLEGGSRVRRPIQCHSSGRHILLVDPKLGDPIDLRIADPRRRWVPRRLSVPLPASVRLLRPALYPGAAYNVAETATGLRGRVVRAGDLSPVPWVRAEARLLDSEGQPIGPPVGRAHGDDRGELLLLLDSLASPLPELADPIEVEITIFGTSTNLKQPPQEWMDPDSELVEPGEALPPGYDRTVSRVVELRLARLLTGNEVDDFVLP